MKKNSLSNCLQKYFNEYLVNDKGCTPATIESYKLGFKSFIRYLIRIKNIKVNALSFQNFDSKTVSEYYRWLIEEENNSVNTRNHRQAIFNSFAKFVITESPELINQMQEILKLPKKKSETKEIKYLKLDAVKLLINQIDRRTLNGDRDYLMVSLLYTTGIRVSELIQIKISDISLEDPASILVHGKGRKNRYVPILQNLKKTFKIFIDKRLSLTGITRDCPLFVNHSNKAFTRQGVAYVLKKYAKLANKENPDAFPFLISPHTMRHSAAMGMLDSGIDLLTIKLFLGHENVTTTEIYAKADAKEKAEAISSHVKSLLPDEEPVWKKESGWKWLLNE